MQATLTTDRLYHKVHNDYMAKLDKDPEFAARFRQLVIEKGWSDFNRIQLGKKIGTSGACATYYMNGDRLPSIEQSRNICAIFNCNVEWLLTGKGSKRTGEEIADPLYKKITSLSSDQKILIEQLLNQIVQHKPASQPACEPACEPSRAGDDC